ncbi:unnamed protein product [Rotaria sordida]|uniref:Uncharacterized protein n=1 Tax=Rotaria sordida TaxID=392033 RepID=A0A819ZCU6_9BILA|nr:unnamed protein product [Rotaria sordida]
MDLHEVTFQSKSGQQQTGLFHRTTKWQQINFWLKNLASMIEKPAENYAYWDQKHHSIVDGNQSISSTIHPSMTTTFDEIKWNDTIEVTFSLDNNNQTVRTLKSIPIYLILNNQELLQNLKLNISPDDCVLILNANQRQFLSQNDMQKSIDRYITYGNNNQPIQFCISILINIIK